MRRRACRAFGPLHLHLVLFDRMRFALFCFAATQPAALFECTPRFPRGGELQSARTGGLYCVQHCNIVQVSFVDELCEKNHPLSTYKFLEHY
jgi:hypothetical protein